MKIGPHKKIEQISNHTVVPTINGAIASEQKGQTVEQCVALEPVRAELKAKQLESLTNNDGEGGEVIVNSRCFKILRPYFNSLNFSNACETSWS